MDRKSHEAMKLRSVALTIALSIVSPLILSSQNIQSNLSLEKERCDLISLWESRAFVLSTAPCEECVYDCIKLKNIEVIVENNTYRISGVSKLDLSGINTNVVYPDSLIVVVGKITMDSSEFVKSGIIRYTPHADARLKSINIDSPFIIKGEIEELEYVWLIATPSLYCALYRVVAVN